jgi:hypothetical protein
METVTARLIITERSGPSAWTWRLTDEAGTALAVQRVDLDPPDHALELANDLYRNLWRTESGSERRFLDRMGAFVADRILGDVGRALAARAPVTVNVELPESESGLLQLPFELAPLADVTFCYQPQPAVARGDQVRRGRPRVLAVFALPGESSALALSRERQALEAQFARYGDAVELRTLQYGVTRAVLGEALADPDGWDVVQISGHGRAGRLFVENEDEGRDTITATQLVDLLSEQPRAPGLVVLFSCESGATRTLRRRPRRAGQAGDLLVDGTENLGYRVAARLGASVLAMRYPVEDEFSIALGQHLYDGLLVRALPIDAALRAAVRTAAAGRTALSTATPMLLGGPSFRLEPARPIVPRPAEPQEAPARFVGRTALIARLVTMNTGAILLTGMPGIGKTACLGEVTAWHRRRGRDVLRHDVTAGETAESLLAALGDGVRERSALVVLDNIDAAPITDVLAQLTAPGARSGFFLAARQPVAGLAVTATVVPLLSRTESELLAREVQEQAQIDDEAATPARPGGWPWLVGRGHPGLIDRRCTGENEARAWEVFTPIPAGRPKLPQDHPGTLIESWAAATATTLDSTTRLLWQFLSALEGPDRYEDQVTVLWPVICAERRVAAEPLAEGYDRLTRAGLTQHWTRGRYLLHPAIARAGRDDDSEVEALTAALLAAAWENRYERWPETGQAEDRLAHAAASSVPYLIRLREWQHASRRCEEAINHDQSPDMAARLLPLLREIVTGQPDAHEQRNSRYVRATVIAQIEPGRARAEYESLFTDAERDGDRKVQATAAFGLASHFIERDPHAAVEWLQRASDSYEGDLAGAPLMRLKRARIEFELGDWKSTLRHAEEVLSDSDGGGPRVNVNSMRSEAMALAAAAASNLGRAATARKWREQIQDQLDRHGGGDRAQAVAQLNVAGAPADNLLVAAQAEFATPADQRELALIRMRQAKRDRERGNPVEAAALARDALRPAYAAGDLWTAADMHEDVALLLARLPEPPRAEIAAHLLASAVIGLRAANLLLALRPPDQLTSALMVLTFLLARRPDDVPHTYADLAALLAATADLDLDLLLSGTERLPVLVDPEGGGPMMPSDQNTLGDSVTDALTWATHWPPPEHLLDPDGHPEQWRSFAEGLAAPNADLQTTADRLRAAGWEALATGFEQLMRGEPANGNLDAIDRAALARIQTR